MYQNKITLTPQEILEKDFKIDTRGYRLKEVDQFLDVIINDYEQFFSIIDSLEKEKADLLREIMALKQEVRNAKMNAEIVKNTTDTTEVNNVDILRRLSQLEKEVYGNNANQYFRQVLGLIPRGKSMLTQSEMIVVFVLKEKIT